MSRRLGAARPDPGREPTIPTRPSIAPLAVVHCLGASKTVTGAKFLVELGGHRLLVDCGLYQGLKELRLRNWAPLPVDPGQIDAVALTHASGCGRPRPFSRPWETLSHLMWLFLQRSLTLLKQVRERRPETHVK